MDDPPGRKKDVPREVESQIGESAIRPVRGLLFPSASAVQEGQEQFRVHDERVDLAVVLLPAPVGEVVAVPAAEIGLAWWEVRVMSLST